MVEAGISIDWAYHPALHLQPVFRNLYGTMEGQLSCTEKILSRHICLPCHPQMSIEDAIHVVRSLRNALDLQEA